jgi:hypothetical protein
MSTFPHYGEEVPAMGDGQAAKDVQAFLDYSVSYEELDDFLQQFDVLLRIINDEFLDISKKTENSIKEIVAKCERMLTQTQSVSDSSAASTADLSNAKRLLGSVKNSVKILTTSQFPASGGGGSLRKSRRKSSRKSCRKSSRKSRKSTRRH